MWRWFKERFLEKIEPPKSPVDIEVDERALELVSLGDKMYSIEDYKGALDAYDSALRADGHCAEAWYRRGRFFAREENNMQAAACFVRALELDTKLAEAWSYLGEAILTFIKSDSEPIFIRENQIEIITEANDCFDRALKLGKELPKAREGRNQCHTLMDGKNYQRINPPIFSFHSGGVLETAKREVVSPFLKPGDYRRKAVPTPYDD